MTPPAASLLNQPLTERADFDQRLRVLQTMTGNRPFTKLCINHASSK